MATRGEIPTEKKKTTPVKKKTTPVTPTVTPASNLSLAEQGRLALMQSIYGTAAPVPAQAPTSASEAGRLGVMQANAFSPQPDVPIVSNPAQAPTSASEAGRLGVMQANAFSPQPDVPIVSNPAQAPTSASEAGRLGVMQANAFSPQPDVPIVSNPAQAPTSASEAGRLGVMQANAFSPQPDVPIVSNAAEGAAWTSGSTATTPQTGISTIDSRGMVTGGGSGLISPVTPTQEKASTSSGSVGTKTGIGTSAGGTAPLQNTTSALTTLEQSMPGGASAPGGASGTNTVMPERQPNVYFDQLVSTQFDYDPATDREYQQAMAMAENAIIQSMIGRGGMYSSVAQSAVSVKLMDLGIEYEQMAYDKYVKERDYMFQLATFEEDRLNTAWNQNFQEMQFQAQQDQARFENEMALAQYKFAVEKEAFNQKMQLAAAARASAAAYANKKAQEAAAKQNQLRTILVSQFSKNALDQSKFNEMKSQWEQDGTANREVAKYFSNYGVQVGEDIMANTDVLKQAERKIVADGYKVASAAQIAGENEMSQSYISSYLQPVVAQPVNVSAETSSTKAKINYMTRLNNWTGSDMTIDSLSTHMRALEKNADKYYTEMGDYYYNKLYDDLAAMKETLRKENLARN